MKILLTAFDPFGNDTINPAWEAVRAAQVPEGLTVHKLQLPTSFARAPQVALEAIERFRPDIVLSFGLAAGRSCVTPETRAFNEAIARIPDNDGAQPGWSPLNDPSQPTGQTPPAGLQSPDEISPPAGVPLIEGGPAVLYSPFEAASLAEALVAAGIPAAPSDSAGRFVCNALFYHLLYHAQRRYLGMKVAFVHVPATPAFLAQSPRRDLPTLPEATLTRAVELLVRHIVTQYK